MGLYCINFHGYKQFLWQPEQKIVKQRLASEFLERPFHYLTKL